VSHSSLYSSQPQGPADQPDFINAVACLETQLEPHALLDALQALEQSHQRVRVQHWGPRTLDLDLLLYGAQTIDTERLSVPHPWLGKRSFVLHPLAEIAPDLRLPSGESIESLLPLCDAGDLNVITAR
jgi:2-amino-4-hydroxy-6-hydroxymethyldihydropteridine diphosphokinase